MPPARLLIADDKSTMRSILRTLLAQRHELEVCGEASNGFEAVEKTKALRPDLVLLDVSMPKMTGIEAASILKSQCPDTSVILFTMYSENIGKALRSAIGVDAVLSKPDGLAALLKTIEDVLEQRSPS